MNFVVELEAPWWLPDYYESYEVVYPPDFEPLEEEWFRAPLQE